MNCVAERNIEVTVDAGASVSSVSSKPEPKVGQKTRSSSQGRDKPSQHSSNGSGGGGGGTARKGKSKKKACPYSLSALWPLVHRHMMQWVAVAMQAVAWFLHLLSDVLGLSSRLSWHLKCIMHLSRCIKQFKYCQVQYSPHIHSNHEVLLWTKKKKKRRSKQIFMLHKNLNLTSRQIFILGVAPTCTDEDIKRYYKRQAFLVHPDKNSQPGAEEAFKILVHAFDIIGEPEKRQTYDCGVARSHQAEAAWSELSDLLSQLHQKMEEAANTIRCTNCGKRHRRVPVDRPCYAARACAQCKIRHAAREGDIWAESSMLGFLWHYYACMEGAVYDITEWAACQADNLRHLRANSHAVQYRIVLGKKHPGSSSRPPPDSRRPPDQPGEPDLEDFLNSLYGQTGAGGSTARKDNDSPQRQAENARKRKGKRKK
ncbi:hypothetical protein B566_EDAN010601 [Ephemera danica]|nr:hypothetical protein B566_EDAN010601 [Ephemera danica]